MQDSDLEALLNKYRPADPPSALEGRIFGTANRRTWPWAVAAAALLAITIGVQAGRRPAPVVDPLLTAAAETLAEAAGGDQDSRAIAEWTLTLATRLSDQRVQIQEPR